MATILKSSVQLIFGKLKINETDNWTSTDDDHTIVTKTGQTTTGAQVDKGNVGSVGAVFIMNTGDTNNLLVSLDGETTYNITIPPGLWAFIPQPTGNVFAKSSASTTDYLAAYIEL